MTKTLTIAVAAALTLGACAGTEAEALELGYGLSLGNTATAEYNVDTEVMSLTTEPTLAYAAPLGVGLSVGTELSIYEDEFVDATFETLPTLDFRADKEVYTGLTVYGEVSYDLEAEERGDAVLGVSFSF